MSTEPFVSIITSTFNHEPYLDDYFNGLLSQTYSNFELILYDDGSPDNTWSKVEYYLPKLLKKLRRVIAERRNNKGSLLELADAIDVSQGEYICILESDDYYYPEKISKTIKFLIENPCYGVVHTNFDRLVDGILLPIEERPPRDRRANQGLLPSGDVLAELLKGNFISTPTSCVKACLLKKYVDFREFRRRGYLMGDYPMWLRLARVTHFGYLNETLSVYRQLQESASHSRNSIKNYRFISSIYQIKRDYLKEFGDPIGIANSVELEYHTHLYYGGFVNGISSDCRTGYFWLFSNNPPKYLSFKHFLRGFCANYSSAWSLLQFSMLFFRFLKGCISFIKRKILCNTLL